MKKALSLILALVLALSVCTVAFAKNEHHFQFGWEQPDFEFDWDFGFDFDDDKEDHHGKPVTPSDAPNGKPQGDKPQQGKPEVLPNQGRPENVPQRPEGGTCTPGDENCPENQEPPVTKTDINDIFDAILHLKDKGFHGGNFHMPKSNDKFFVVGMIINDDGSVEFVFIEKGKEDKGPQRFPAHKDDVTGTDVTGTDVTGTDIPDGMDFITMGDTDVDGKVNAKDALQILKHIVKKAIMAHEGQKFLADMNADTIIDAKDALHVLRKSVGKEN